jgi:threonine/homoserine/homoserine lactone efflux protein
VEQLLGFAGISVVVIVTPGPDTLLTIRSTLAGARRAGIATAAGVATGQAIWSLAASIGVTAVLVASEPIFATVKVLGAIYLIYLGLVTLYRALVGTMSPAAGPAPAASGARARTAFRQGVLSNLGNPKMAVFFSSLLPQFAPATGSTIAVLLALGLLFCLMTLTWLVAYALVVARAGDVLRRSGVKRAIEALTGAVLAALGLGLLLEPRRA